MFKSVGELSESQAVKDATEKALGLTATCRQVVPEGEEDLGAEVVVVRPILPGPPRSYGPGQIASSIHIYVDLRLNDSELKDEPTAIGLIDDAATQLGALENQEVVQGAPVAPPPAVPPPSPARTPRTLATVRAQLNVSPAGGATTDIPIAGPRPAAGVVRGVPTAAELETTIHQAVTALNRPGRPLGLLLSDRLVTVLRQIPPGRVDPPIKQIEQLGGGIQVVGTPALSGALNVQDVCGVLFCQEPPAIDVVWTQRPTVTDLGRTGGLNHLRVEEDIAVRVHDQAGIHHIRY